MSLKYAGTNHITRPNHTIQCEARTRINLLDVFTKWLDGTGCISV